MESYKRRTELKIIPYLYNDENSMSGRTRDRSGVDKMLSTFPTASPDALDTAILFDNAAECRHRSTSIRLATNVELNRVWSGYS